MFKFHRIGKFLNNLTEYLRLKEFYIVLLSYVHCATLGVMLKIKWSRYRPGVARRVGRIIDLLFHDRGTAALEGGEWSAARPGCTLPPGKTPHPFYRRLGGPQGRTGRRENLVPTGIRSRTVQPVVSRYTDWATRPTCIMNVADPNLS
jgi:hypothetical protein